MRTITTTVLTFCFVFILFSSCTKEAVSSSVTQTITSAKDAGSLISLAGDTTTLTLQPGPDDGEDCYVEFLAGSPLYASSNQNYDPELAISAWTVNGAPLKQRTYIKFTGISTLPAGAHIASAQLYLYGLDPNTSLTAPQGNSLYPGSPYSSYTNNGCYVSAVTGADWLEDSIVWNNMPTFYATKFDGVIASSTSQWNYDISASVTDLVKAMIKRNRNNGFCIYLQNENIYRCLLFASSEASSAAKRPKLVIRYTM